MFGWWYYFLVEEVIINLCEGVNGEGERARKSVLRQNIRLIFLPMHYEFFSYNVNLIST